MALAPYFAKITQSASSLLAGFDAGRFTEYLGSQRVALAFDATDGPEARATLDLALDLLARLYPAVDVIPLGSDSAGHALASRLLNEARRINPAIEGGVTFVPGTAATLVVGKTRAPWDGAGTPTVYIGSDGWLVRASSDHPVGSSHSTNPFGAGAAACIGAANVFRAVFGAQLLRRDLDRDLNLSLVDYELGAAANRNPSLPERIEIDETFLVGVGAIGHGAVWALRRTAGLQGTLHLVDDEGYEDTNAQRYVETVTAEMTSGKVTYAAAILGGGLSRELIVAPHPVAWDEYLDQRSDWRLDRIALALDSAEDRVFAQASLPKHIFNSWTQADNLGVSRHDFPTTACVACLYLPASQRPDLDDLVASALRFQGEDELREIRRFLDTDQPLDQAFIVKIADRVGVAPNVLLPFVGAPLLALYHRAACAGLILQFGGHLGGDIRRVEVPMAFQSAMAGILLAAEVVIDASGIRSDALPVRTEINLLKPIAGTLCSPEPKHSSGRCICQDPDFLRAYQEKYLATDATC